MGRNVATAYAGRMRALIVDGANVVGSRPTGWWRDRAEAARRLHEALSNARLEYDEVVLVLEGAAKQGQPAGSSDGVLTVHAPGVGDDEIVQTVRDRVSEAADVVVVTADRALRDRVEATGGSCVGPSWLLGQLA